MYPTFAFTASRIPSKPMEECRSTVKHLHLRVEHLYVCEIVPPIHQFTGGRRSTCLFAFDCKSKYLTMELTNLVPIPSIKPVAMNEKPQLSSSKTSYHPSIFLLPRLSREKTKKLQIACLHKVLLLTTIYFNPKSLEIFNNIQPPRKPIFLFIFINNNLYCSTATLPLIQQFAIGNV